MAFATQVVKIGSGKGHATSQVVERIECVADDLYGLGVDCRDWDLPGTVVSDKVLAAVDALNELVTDLRGPGG